MKKSQVLMALGLAGAGLILRNETRYRLPPGEGPATGLFEDGRPGTALITGGSSGIGATFARHLAAQGYDLVLVARRQDRLDALAADLANRHGVNVETCAADLATEEGIARIEECIQGLDHLALLINNAGFATGGYFARVDPQRHHEMVTLHVMAPTRLSRAALPGLVRRRRGAIVNVASLAAFVPLPGGANYSATKAYLVMFSRGLANESRNRNVQIQALCPGFTRTELLDSQDVTDEQANRIPRALWGAAEDVVTESLACLAAGGPVICIPGLKNRALATLARRLPAPAVDWMLSQRMIQK